MPGRSHGPRHRTNEKTVVHEKKHAAEAEQNAGGEAAKRDADVVVDVESGHHAVRAFVATVAQVAVGFLHLLHHRFGHDLNGEAARPQRTDETENAGQHEQHGGDDHEPGVTTHALRKPGGDQTAQSGQAVRRRAVHRRAGARGQRIEQVAHLRRIARRSCPHEVGTDLAVKARSTRNRGWRQLVQERLFREQGIELVPGRFARGHEFVLRAIHVCAPACVLAAGAWLPTATK